MTAWMDDAACKGMTDVFFPARGDTTDTAKAICAECPVLEECRDYILENPKWHGSPVSGVWGGLSGFERKRMLWPSRRQPHDNVCVVCRQPFTTKAANMTAWMRCQKCWKADVVDVGWRLLECPTCGHTTRAPKPERVLPEKWALRGTGS